MRLDGIETKIMKLRHAGICNTEISQILDIPPSTVTRAVTEAAKSSGTYKSCHAPRPKNPKARREDTWSEDRVERLKELWKAGLSCSEIAREMGGLTRNAVIGKVTRLGLSGRKVAKRKTAPHTPKAKKRHKKKHLDYGLGLTSRAKICAPSTTRVERYKEPEPHPEDIATVKSVSDLEEHHCRWPIGDPLNDFKGFCGCRSAEGSSYCKHHTARSSGYVPGPSLMATQKNEATEDLPETA